MVLQCIVGRNEFLTKSAPSLLSICTLCTCISIPTLISDLPSIKPYSGTAWLFVVIMIYFGIDIGINHSKALFFRIHQITNDHAFVTPKLHRSQRHIQYLYAAIIMEFLMIILIASYNCIVSSPIQSYLFILCSCPGSISFMIYFYFREYLFKTKHKRVSARAIFRNRRTFRWIDNAWNEAYEYVIIESITYTEITEIIGHLL